MSPAGADPSAELESIAQQLADLGNYHGAVQVLTQAASLALQSGRSDRFDRLFQQGFDLAARHNLQYLELNIRVQKAQLQLTSARAGAIVDSIAAEAKAKNSELSNSIRRYCDAALATCDAIATADSAGALAAVDAAIRSADAFELAETGGLLANWRSEKAPLEDLRAIGARLRGELEARRATLATAADLIRAAVKGILGDCDSPIEILTRAAAMPALSAGSQAQIYMALADAYAARAGIEKALSPAAAAADLELAEQAAATAVEAAGRLTNVLEKQAPAAKLLEIQDLRGSGAGSAGTGPGFYGAMATGQAALRALADHRPADALAVLDQAQGAPLEAHSMALGVRAAALYELGRDPEAIDDLDARISHLEQQGRADTGEFSYAFSSRLEELQNLSIIKACALVRMGRPVEAWEASERGRTALESAPASWETWRTWLQKERAAFVSFALGRWGVLVLAAAPGDPQPTSQLLDGFRYSNLAPQFLNGAEEDSQVWTSLIFDAVPALSERLIGPLEPLLERLTGGAEVLYILPDAYLFRAPFAAMTLGGGQFLGDLCPLAVAPSAAFVLAAASRASEAPQSCLALGVGQAPKDKPVVRFSQQAADLAGLWTAPRSSTTLLDGDATAAALRQSAAACGVLHLACHGATSSGVRDPLAASQLELADGPLAARAVMGWNLPVDLVFMNVCQGGRFRMEGRSNVSGFLRAFHAAGARSVIASVTHIDPMPAGELALRFYRHWLPGVSKARALQRAQQEVRQLYPTARDWAAHALTGDYR